MWKKELLDKIYDKYQMELSRRDRLDSKSIGYYTILGIFFAAFLVVEPLLFNQGILVKFSINEILSIINILSVLAFISLFLISIFILHNSYKQKSRTEFDPVANWDALVSQDNEDIIIESLKKNLTEIIIEYESENEVKAHKLNLINMFCIICGIIIVVTFVALIATYYI